MRCATSRTRASCPAPAPSSSPSSSSCVKKVPLPPPGAAIDRGAAVDGNVTCLTACVAGVCDVSFGVPSFAFTAATVDVVCAFIWDVGTSLAFTAGAAAVARPVARDVGTSLPFAVPAAVDAACVVVVGAGIAARVPPGSAGNPGHAVNGATGVL